MSDSDLRQRDLSNLRIAEMNTAERAEMRRRYHDFVSRLGGSQQAPEPRDPGSRKQPRRISRPSWARPQGG